MLNKIIMSVATIGVLTACQSEDKPLEQCLKDFLPATIATHKETGNEVRIMEIVDHSVMLGFYCNNNGTRGSHYTTRQYKVKFPNGDIITVKAQSLI